MTATMDRPAAADEDDLVIAVEMAANASDVAALRRRVDDLQAALAETVETLRQALLMVEGRFVAVREQIAMLERPR